CRSGCRVRSRWRRWSWSPPALVAAALADAVAEPPEGGERDEQGGGREQGCERVVHRAPPSRAASAVSHACSAVSRRWHAVCRLRSAVSHAGPVAMYRALAAAMTTTSAWVTRSPV